MAAGAGFEPATTGSKPVELPIAPSGYKIILQPGLEPGSTAPKCTELTLRHMSFARHVVSYVALPIKLPEYVLVRKTGLEPMTLCL